MSFSSSQWGSPNAPRRAFLIHGLTMSSNSWESIAQLLVAEGFFVVAPNLLGHAWRRGNDYRVSTLAEDLRPYFATNTSYDVIIGHSLGGTVALALLPFLPKGKETTIVLVDPALEFPDEQLARNKIMFLKEVASLRSPDEHMAENPVWSRSDCMSRTLGLSMCSLTAVDNIFEHNKPWSFIDLFKNVPSNMTISMLLSDPAVSPPVCCLGRIPRDGKKLNVRVLSGISHWIQFECPDAIMDAIPLPRAKL